jgi:predicted YcjX-like family ATPase
MFEYSRTQSLFERDDEERQLALQYLAEAWRNADVEGVEKEALAHAALFAAIATLVEQYGEEPIAKLLEKLPGQVELGEYTVDRTIQ